MLVPIKAKESELYFYEGPSEADMQKKKNAVHKESSSIKNDGKEILQRWWKKMKANFSSQPMPRYY